MTYILDELVRLDRDGGRFVFHVPTSSVFELDGPTCRLLDAAEAAGGGTEAELVELAVSAGIGRDEAGLTVADLLKLRLLVMPSARGAPLHDPMPPGEGIRNLTLHVAHSCNLACRYCYADHGLYKGPRTLMSPEQASLWVDWLFDQADEDTEELGISFFGGEPLLAFDAVRQAALHARARADAAGLRLRFGITTNGTLVTEEIAEFLLGIGAVVTVSLDGVGSTNDRLRPFASGRGSYARVLERVRPLLERGRTVARATVTRLNLDVVETVETLLAEGFAEVGCSPVDAGDPELDLRGEDYQVLLEGFEVLVRRFVDQAVDGHLYGFSNIATIVKAIHAGHNKPYPCGAGIKMVAASPDGTMSLCHRFVGEPDYVLGTREEGLDPSRRRAMLEAISLDRRTGCDGCWARFLCSGGCHHVNFLFGGDPSVTYKTHCDWLRAWYQTGLEAYAEILRRNPTFIRKFLDPGWVCPSS